MAWLKLCHWSRQSNGSLDARGGSTTCVWNVDTADHQALVAVE